MPPTIREAAAALRSGRLSCGQLLEQCLARIDRLEDPLRAWVLIDRDGARYTAAARDRELARGIDRGPLHGIPVGVKDIFDVFDWPTACGSRRWQYSYARQDAPAVARLRQAGAVLLGKTVTTAYASFDPPPTRNPWRLDRTPGGSSSGSAVAVAAGMCLAALASQTGGSITRPASYCGVPACKPTYGRIDTGGVLPLAPSLDHVGAMARTVADVAVVIQAIADPGGAAITHPTPQRGMLTSPMRQRGMPIIARLHGLFDRLADEPTRAMLEATCQELSARGATVRDVDLPAAFAEVLPRHRIVMAVEAAAYHRDRLARHPDDYPPNIRALIEEGMATPAPEYALTRKHQQRLTAEMARLFAGYDALLCPATPTAAPDACTTGDPAFNSPWSYTGLPVVSVPTALDPAGLPLGVQLVGPAGSEATLLQIAAWFEEGHRPGVGEPPLLREAASS